MSDFDFSGRGVLVVGGSSGIGNGIAHAFCNRGAEVEVWGTRADAQAYEGTAGSDLAGLRYHQVDVVDRHMLEGATTSLDRLDVVVLCQGGPMNDGAEYNLANFEAVVALNLTSVMACAMKFEASLKQTRGALIIVNSVSAFGAQADIPAYVAAKAGVSRLTAALANGWAKYGVRVNGIAPGLVPTKITKAAQDPGALEWLQQFIPLGRPGTPDDMAGVALFLASPFSAYVTGQTILVDGGLLLQGLGSIRPPG